MSGIKALTPAQEARFPEFVERWRALGLSTTPTDRRAAERVIRRCYERAGLKTPERFIWLKSPLAGALAYDLLTVKHSVPHSDSVRASVWNRVWESVVHSAKDSIQKSVPPGFIPTTVRHSRAGSLWHGVVDGVWDSVWQSVGVHVWFGVWDSIRDGVRDSIRASVRASVEASAGDNRIAVNSTRGSLIVFGSHRPTGFLSYYSYFLEVCGLRELERLDGLIDQAKHCGWWWPFENLVIATEKPVALHLDERGRLHHATEAAIAYGDGWGVYAWHGIRLPPRYYDQPVTAQQILHERNAAVRRALIERYGQERLFLDAGAAGSVSHWQIALRAYERWQQRGCPVGSPEVDWFRAEEEFARLRCDAEHGAELISIDLPGDPERRMVALKLRCPSTSAVSIVRVPPYHTEARAALAWSFGLQDASEYVLAGES